MVKFEAKMYRNNRR